jgi:DNA recombination protein RmuC
MLDLGLYIAGSLAFLFGLGAFYFYSKYFVVKTSLDFIVSQETILKDKIDELEDLKVQNIRKIQELESENKYLTEIYEDQEKSQKEAFSSAKAALFDLGGELSKQLLEIHKQENKQSKESSEKRIAESSEKFQKEFERVVNMVSQLNKDISDSKSTVDIIKQSLLSPTGAGNLAEITLENILKASGLRYGTDFLMQHTIAGEYESKLRPDAIIKLPGGNVMVVDAKASKFLLDIEGDESKDGQNKLLKAMNLHLKSLSSKEYVSNVVSSFNLEGEDIHHSMMLMFLPTEYAVDKITNFDPEFIKRAWEKNIFPVGPSGLMNMLSFARFQINDNIRSANHNAIIEEVKKIITSISLLTDYSQKIGANIQSLVGNYDKFSASFNRNFLSKVFSIEKLGIEVPSKKSISTLSRYQLVSSKAQLIDAEVIEEEEEEA